MKYAIIRTGGKQHKVQEGDEISFEKIEGKEGNKVTFKNILLIVENGKVEIGRPLVSKAIVSGEIIAQIKDKKIRVAKYKAKSRYRKVKGHRQQLTKVRIKKISSKSKTSSSPVRKKKTASAPQKTK